MHIDVENLQNASAETQRATTTHVSVKATQTHMFKWKVMLLSHALKI